MRELLEGVQSNGEFILFHTGRLERSPLPCMLGFLTVLLSNGTCHL